MKLSEMIFVATLAIAFSSPASAAVVVLAKNVDLSASPFTIRTGPDSSYTFSNVLNGSSSVAVSMAGTAQVYGNGFFSPNSPDPLQVDVSVPGQLSLGQFFKQTGTKSIPFSIAQTFIALNFTSGGQNYYGYAGVGGSFLTSFAYNDTPNGSILTGQLPVAAAVPEPTVWMMMILGFGAIGFVMRRRQRGAAPSRQSLLSLA